jgi:mannose-6-phosphate isomerase-like protein (cupin superfamily)
MQVVRGSEIEFVPASHEDPKNPGVLKRVLATKAHLSEGRVQMLNWSRLPQGSSFQAHYHEDMQEVFVILNGTVEMVVAEETVELTGGDAILIEMREVHQMHNRCDDDVDYLVFGIATGQNGKTVVVQ